MVASLAKWLPKHYRFNEPKMGVCTWVYAPDRLDGIEFFTRCLHENVFVVPGDAFAVEDPIPGFQVKLGTVPPKVLDEGIRRISRLLR
jgi:GntR family transcriptional regulator/MocR family aminotransferase